MSEREQRTTKPSANPPVTGPQENGVKPSTTPPAPAPTPNKGNGGSR